MVLRTIELCAGYGGMSLGLRIAYPAARTVCYVEREAFPAAVLVQAMEQGRLDPAPVWSDLATFDGKPWRGVVDLVTAGFPCQPWSVAGKRGGEDDERYSGVWPQIARIVGECRPSLVFLENVSLDAFRGPRDDLESLGYRVPTAVRVSASDVGAPHYRDRWWCLAVDPDADCDGRLRREELHGEPLSGVGVQFGDDAVRLREDVPNPNCSGLEVRLRQPSDDGPQCAPAIGGPWWACEPDVLRVVDGYPTRVDRLRAIGNGIVPLCGGIALDILMERN